MRPYKCLRCGCTETYRSGKDRKCRDCHKRKMRAYYQTEGYKTRNRIRSRFVRRSNGTWEEYRALEQKQDYCCAICGKRLAPGKLYFDHCHATQKRRGLLCWTCNTALGLFKDSIRLLENGVQYIRQFQ